MIQPEVVPNSALLSDLQCRMDSALAQFCNVQPSESGNPSSMSLDQPQISQDNLDVETQSRVPSSQQAECEGTRQRLGATIFGMAEGSGLVQLLQRSQKSMQSFRTAASRAYLSFQTAGLTHDVCVDAIYKTLAPTVSRLPHPLPERLKRNFELALSAGLSPIDASRCARLKEEIDILTVAQFKQAPSPAELGNPWEYRDKSAFISKLIGTFTARLETAIDRLPLVSGTLQGTNKPFPNIPALFGNPEPRLSSDDSGIWRKKRRYGSSTSSTAESADPRKRWCVEVPEFKSKRKCGDLMRYRPPLPFTHLDKRCKTNL